jgi:hypothetical protein
LEAAQTRGKAEQAHKISPEKPKVTSNTPFANSPEYRKAYNDWLEKTKGSKLVIIAPLATPKNK